MIDRNRDLDQASQRPPERRFLGWLLFPIALFPLIALLTYDWRTQDQTPPAASSNWFGPMGDMFAYYGYKIFGLAICMASTGFLGGSVVKNPPTNAGDTGLILGLGRSPGGWHGNPLQYSCLENPMDNGAWRATVHGVAKSGA